MSAVKQCLVCLAKTSEMHSWQCSQVRCLQPCRTVTCTANMSRCGLNNSEVTYVVALPYYSENQANLRWCWVTPMNFAELPFLGQISPLKSCMVAWAGLDPSKVWFYMLNRHFSDSIFDLFLTGHSKNMRANRKVKHFVSIFGVKSSSPSNFFFSCRSKRVAMYLIHMMTMPIGCYAGIRRSKTIGETGNF